MAYTDKTSDFYHKKRLDWQDFDELADNDAFLLSQVTAYRRPVLQYKSASVVTVEANAPSAANTTVILFPDGESRTVTEDLATLDAHRGCDLSQALLFASGTINGGVRSGISEATETWYAIYAVKVTKVGETSDFTLAADTTFPTQANFATLNTRYGTSGWVYLGMVRNGYIGATGDIADFVQSGNRTIFKNTTSGFSPGFRLATVTGAATLTYTYAAGGGAAEIPGHLSHAIYQCKFSASATGGIIQTSAGAYAMARLAIDRLGELRVETAAVEGIKLSNAAASSIDYDIYLVGFVDGVLGVGFNPVI